MADIYDWQDEDECSATIVSEGGHLVTYFTDVPARHFRAELASEGRIEYLTEVATVMAPPVPEGELSG